MKMLSKLSVLTAMAIGTAGLTMGCEETVSKNEETKTRSDGSTRTESETVKKQADGTVKTEKSVEKTPPTNP